MAPTNDAFCGKFDGPSAPGCGHTADPARGEQLMLKRLACALPVLTLVFAAVPYAQSKFTLKVHTGRGQIGYDVNSTMVIGEKDILLIDPQFSLSEAPQAGGRDPRIEEAPRHDLFDTSAPGSSVRTGGAEAGVPRREDGRAAGHSQRGEDRVAGAAEILVRDIRHEH